jgi:hypothetical protein
MVSDTAFSSGAGASGHGKRAAGDATAAARAAASRLPRRGTIVGNLTSVLPNLVLIVAGRVVGDIPASARDGGG